MCCMSRLYYAPLVNNTVLGFTRQAWKEPKRFSTCASGKPPHKSHHECTSDTRTLCVSYVRTLFVWAEWLDLFCVYERQGINKHTCTCCYRSWAVYAYRRLQVHYSWLLGEKTANNKGSWHAVQGVQKMHKQDYRNHKQELQQLQAAVTSRTSRRSPRGWMSINYKKIATRFAYSAHSLLTYSNWVPTNCTA
jgi:hypothetical protein